MTKVKHAFSLLALCGLLSLSPSHAVAQGDYVGSQACQDCHQGAFEHWQGSQHQLAMADAAPDTVLGNFDNQAFELGQHKARFFMRDGQYWVQLADPFAKAKTHQVLYTFGLDPLQQYLVALPGGRLQLLPYAWDSRPVEQGGQRWFHLYPEMTPEDEFYWRNPGQNWNTMCADCHVTRYDKGYESESDSYYWDALELGVGCEACHGPGKAHQDWAKAGDNSLTDPGFARDLGRAVSQWQPGNPTATPGARQDSEQLDACAQCHSRRLQVSEGHEDLAFHHNYLLNLVDSLRYHPDGQVADENFVMGSFLQSKMHGAGVVCSDCHQPHSAELLLPEPELCSRCHQAEVFDTPEHHHHAMDSDGARCSNCHMPTTTFMQVDDRKDHSFRVPRADLALSLGVPLVCTQCHDDKNATWAAGQLDLWYPGGVDPKERHFAQAFAAAEQGHPQGIAALSYVAQDVNQPDILRASALARLQGARDRNALVALARASRSDADLLRFGVIEGSGALPVDEQWSLLSPLLEDTNPLIRAQAAGALSPHYAELSEPQRKRLAPALAEYESYTAYNADRGFGLNNLGNLANHMGDVAKAESQYRRAIEIEPIFAYSYVNLAALYRGQNRPVDEAKVLAEGRAALPGSALLAHQQGLMAIRQGKNDAALVALEEAVDLDPNNVNYRYVYGLALEPTAPAEAVKALMASYRQSQDPRFLYGACEIGLRNQLAGAQNCLSQLGKVVPADVVNQLRQRYPQ